MFALYEWFILPMTITRQPSRSFFLFSFCFIFSMHVCKKSIHPLLSMRKAFFFVHLRSYTRKKHFSLYTHALKNSFSLYRHGLYKTSIPFQRFLFPFSIYTRFIQKNLFIYTHCSYTRNSFHTFYIQKTLFTHCLYTKKTFHTLFIYKKFFSFLYIQIWHFVHNASFLFYSWHYHDVCSFYFRMTFLNENSTRFRNCNKYYRQ